MADYATLLRDHVILTCRSVDRIFLQAYAPKLQSVGGDVSVSALAEGIRDSVVGGVRQNRRRRCRAGVPVGHGAPFAGLPRGENKEQIAWPLIEAAEKKAGEGRVVLIGIAQERPRCGGPGRSRARSTRCIRTWSGPAGRWFIG
jgi:hypothetical protein